MPRPADFVSDAPRPERRCCLCDGFPTLYVASGKLYCKAHKAEAEAVLLKAVKCVVSGHSRNSNEGSDSYLQDRRKLKRDHPYGRYVVR